MNDLRRETRIMDSPLGNDGPDTAHTDIAIGKTKPRRPIVKMRRFNIKPAHSPQHRRSGQDRIDVRIAHKNIAKTHRVVRYHMRRNVRQFRPRPRNDPSCHPKTETRPMTFRRLNERSDPVRQRHIVIIEKNDEFTASRRQSHIPRPSHPAHMRPKHRNPAVQDHPRRIERPPIIHHENFQLAICLGTNRGQRSMNILRT